MYVATIALSSCGGCHQSLFLAGEPLVALLCDNNISFSSNLVDAGSMSPSDVVLATGAIRNGEELEIADEIGRTTRKVIAVGSCAVYGGVTGIGTVKARQPGSEESGIPALLDVPLPLDSRIDIEAYIPGCPPQPDLIFETLRSVLEGYDHPGFDGTVCSECTRGVEHKGVKEWSRHPGYAVPSMLCLLNKGFFCLGPVTRGGCQAACPLKGAACIGCRGPSGMVLSSQLHSVFSDMVKFVSLTTGTRDEKTARQLMAMLREFYVFTRRDPVTRARAGEKVPGD